MSKDTKEDQKNTMNRRDFGKFLATGSIAVAAGAMMPEAVFAQTAGEEFRGIRRKERTLDEKETWKVMESASYGLLGTASAGGQPHVVPISYGVNNGKIYFHGARTGLKTDNMKANPKVSFTVVAYAKPIFIADPFDYSQYYASAIAYGTPHILSGEEKKDALINYIVTKYFPENVKGVDAYYDRLGKAIDVYIIDIKHITGKAHVSGAGIVYPQS